MSGAERRLDLLLRVLARTLPPLARERYLEEWRADAAAAPTAGLRSRDVLLGAAAVGLTLDRDLPTHSGEPRGALPRRLARRGIAMIAGATAILIGVWLTGGGIVPEGAAATAAVVAMLQVLGGLVVVAALVLGIAGVLFTAGAATTARTGLARAALAAAVAGPLAIGVAMTVPSAPPVVGIAGAIVSMLGLVGGTAVVAGTTPLALQPRTSTRRQRLPIAIAGAALVIAVVVVGAIDTVVWNPLAKAPGLPLDVIYERMIQDDGFFMTYNFGMVAVWAAVWAVPSLVLVGFAARRRLSGLTPRRIAIVMLGLVAGAVFFRFFAGFGFGMSLADTFVTDGGDASVVSAVLPILGQLALAAALVAVGWAPRIRPAGVGTVQPVG